MASVRDQIAAAVVTKLGGVGKPTGVTVHRHRTRALASDTLPAMVVYLVREDSRRVTTALTAHVLRLRVECRVAGEPVDQTLDPLIVWAVKAITADPTLGGLANWVQEAEKQWQAEAADQSYGACAVDFDIETDTAASNPESRN